MSDNTIVTVVVPVYDTAAYLPDCLNSILAQTLVDIEVLCVDDHSTDGSRHILHTYERRDPRVRVLESPRPSVGPGAARNHAIEQARGAYVACVDSDDIIDERMLAQLHNAAEANGADVSMCLFAKFTESEDRTSFAPCTYDRAIPDSIDDSNFSWRQIDDIFQLRFASCNKLYRRSFLEENKLRYAEDGYYEDLVFTYRALLEARRLALVREYLYLNRKERAGATTFAQGDRAADALGAMDALDQVLREAGLSSELGDAFAAFRFRKLSNLLHKNDDVHLPAFYERLREVARDPALDNNPHLAAPYRERRDRVRDSELLTYLSWELWQCQRRASGHRRRAVQYGRTNRQLELENRKLRARNERLEGRRSVLETRSEQLKATIDRSIGMRLERAAKAPLRRVRRLRQRRGGSDLAP